MPSVQKLLFDKRLVERHLRQGRIQREEYDKLLAELEDSSSHADWVNVVPEVAEPRASRRAAVEVDDEDEDEGYTDEDI